MFRKMLSKYRIFSTVLSKIVGIYLTWVVSASLNSGREKTSLALTSNCFLLLNLNSEADLCIFDWPSKSLPCASSLVSRCPLNKESSSSTSSELWGLGFAEGSLGFDSSTTDSASDISAIKLTVNASESGMRERERAHSTRTNLWCRLTNQKVRESPVENCNIPAEKTFTVNKWRFLDSVFFAFFICSKKCEMRAYERKNLGRKTFLIWPEKKLSSR